MASALSRARERLAARKKVLATAKAAVKKAQAAVTETARTVKRLSLPKPARGIDISNHQGMVDFAAVKRAGYSFVYAKATEGVGFTDAFFARNVRGARAAGLQVGAYHFLRPRPGRTGAVEACEFATALNHVGLVKGKCLRPVVDVEVTDVGPMVTEAYVASFVAELRKLTGITPLIYTFPAFLRWRSTHGCQLWIANFGVAKPTVPAPWKRFAIWQHSSTAKVPGVSGSCDVNRCPDMRKIVA